MSETNNIRLCCSSVVQVLISPSTSRKSFKRLKVDKSVPKFELVNSILRFMAESDKLS